MDDSYYFKLGSAVGNTASDLMVRICLGKGLVYNGLVEAEVPVDEPIEEDVIEEEATEEIVE